MLANDYFDRITHNPITGSLYSSDVDYNFQPANEQLLITEDNTPIVDENDVELTTG